MRSSRVSLRPATTQVSVSGTPASTSAWRTCQPQAVATTSASAPGQIGHPPAGPGEQVQDAELGEDDLVPVGAGADHTGETAHAVGEGAGAGVDEACGELVPRRVAGERRVGETGADAIVEPALELDETADETLDALVPLALEIDGAARPARRRRLPACSASDGDGGNDLGAGVPARPGAHATGCCAGGNLSLHPHDEQGEGVLARLRAAGAGASPGRVGVVDHRVVGLAPGPRAPTPQRLLVGAEHDPSRRHGECVGGGEARRRRRDRHHLLDRPPHPCDVTEGVRARDLGANRDNRRSGRGSPRIPTQIAPGSGGAC